MIKLERELSKAIGKKVDLLTEKSISPYLHPLIKKDIKTAAKMAAGEVFLPVLSGTLTTLMPFVPLAFWPGMMGKFIFYLPVTLIITLLASLLVAYIINPVFAVDFMKPHNPDEASKQKKWTRGTSITTILFVAIGLLLHLFQLQQGCPFLLILLPHER